MFRASSSRSGLLGRIAIIVLTVALLVMLGFIHFKWWPWLIYQPVLGVSDLQGSNQLRTYMTITDDGILNVYALHAQAMLSVEENRKSMSHAELNLENLVQLSGVLDAFYINFENQNAVSSNKLIPDQLLIEKLDMRDKPAGGASQITRRLIGGLTRFRRVKVNDEAKYPVMIRYLDTFYPSYATEAIGLVLDEKWLVDQIPSRLDSLMKNNTNMLFFAPTPPDTVWGQQEDPYACPGGTWKQTAGVLYAGDTLWWYGNRKPSERDKGYAIKQPLQGFDLSTFVRVNFPEYAEDVSKGRKSVNRIFVLLEIIGSLIILVLFVSIAMTNKQASRNQIALAHLAHSIKTPVARIRLDTDSLLEEMVASPAEEREIITAIGRECGRMERAVQSAALSLEEGKRTLNLEACDLTKIVTNTKQAWQPQFDQAGIELKIDSTDEPISSRFDAEMIAVMIDNLLDNALRHTMLNLENTEQNAAVTVTLKKSGGNAEIIIDDTGAGIPEADRKHIFKRFQRVRGDAASGVSGLGLGLSLVKEIAEAHGGNVRIDDKDSGGARFVVELPLSQD
ncbi:MAG: HAMP domain-containing histidine kinase [Calditrichaeota bacterium]|nr:HAMP domain-containing histidine kinase [Calditrichota bacterium]